MFRLVALLGSPLVACHLVNPRASSATKRLYQALLDVGQAKEKTMFGHQDDLLSGYSWFHQENEAFKDVPDSDVMQATGHYPKVFGCDIGNIWKAPWKHGMPQRNVDGIPRMDIFHYVRKAHEMGGVITMTMHNDNPMTKQNYADMEPGTVKSILKGGRFHDYYMGQLRDLADFVQSLAVPVLFRPYHEANKDHEHKGFWWGLGPRGCTRDEYIELWKMTVELFNNRTDNVLFVYSPQDAFTVKPHPKNDSAQEYFGRYPGDDYVDIFGFDSYSLAWGDATSGTGPIARALKDLINHSLGMSETKALKKPVAFTEAGYCCASKTDVNLPLHSHFWSALEWVMEKYVYAETRHRLSWVLVWRNYMRTWNVTTHEWHNIPQPVCHAPSPVARDICETDDFFNKKGNLDAHVQFLPKKSRRLQALLV